MKKLLKVCLLAVTAVALFGCGNGNSEKGGSWTVEFMLNNGTSDVYKTVEVNNGEKVTAPTDPTRNGYTFGGWFVDEACQVYFDEGSEVITSNTKLYASWASSGLENPNSKPETSENNTQTSENNTQTSENNGNETENVITIYFTNNMKWSGTINYYVWNDEGPKASWPGEAMTFVETNGYGEDIYTVDVDLSVYNCIIFNDGTNQTCDIPLDGITENTGFYVDGSTFGTYQYASVE